MSHIVPIALKENSASTRRCTQVWRNVCEPGLPTAMPALCR